MGFFSDNFTFQSGLFHGFDEPKEPEDTFSDMLVDAAVDQWWDKKHQRTHNMLMATKMVTEDPVTGERLNDSPPTGPVDWDAIANTKTGIDSIDRVDLQGSDPFYNDFPTLDDYRGWTLLSYGRDLSEDEISAWRKNHNF